MEVWPLFPIRAILLLMGILLWIDWSTYPSATDEDVQPLCHFNVKRSAPHLATDDTDNRRKQWPVHASASLILRKVTMRLGIFAKNEWMPTAGIVFLLYNIRKGGHEAFKFSYDFIVLYFNQKYASIILPYIRLYVAVQLFSGSSHILLDLLSCILRT